MGLEFGHHVSLATHVNFSTFVKSAGIDFYPLGGFNVKTVEYKNISFTVWDVGGQDKVSKRVTRPKLLLGVLS
ncbi:hypothetical protein ACSBR1_011429 [Camellia fascicularis]